MPTAEGKRAHSADQFFLILRLARASLALVQQRVCNASGLEPCPRNTVAGRIGVEQAERERRDALVLKGLFIQEAFEAAGMIAEWPPTSNHLLTPSSFFPPFFFFFFFRETVEILGSREYKVQYTRLYKTIVE